MVKRKKRPLPELPPQRPNFIKAWRVFRGITSQLELGNKAGITRATVSRLESGKMPYNQRQLERIAIVLECTPGDLIEIDPETTGTLFKIYAGIPVLMRSQAADVLQTFVKKNKRK